MQNVAFENPEPAIHYFQKPSLLLRIKSTLIDGVVVVGLLFVASAIFNQIGVASGAVKGIVFFAVFLYEPIFTSLNQTIGQRIMGLRVCQLSAYTSGEGKQNIHLFASFFRYISKLLLGWISLLTIHSDKYGQAIHDKAANSVMTVSRN